MIKVKWHQSESFPNPKMLNEALTKAVRERIRKKFGLEYEKTIFVHRSASQLALPIFKWWSREHFKANRLRRQRRREAKRERKHWREVNGRGRVV